MNTQNEKVIQSVLDRICPNHNTKGYVYISDAVGIVIEHRQNRTIPRRVIHDVADMNNDSYSAADRAVNYFVSSTWNSDSAALKQMFGYSTKPTVTNFVATLADFIRLNYKELENGTYQWREANEK